MRDPNDYTGLIVKMAKQFRPSFPKKDFKDLMQDGWMIFSWVCEKEKKQPLPVPFHTALGMHLKQQWLCELKAETYQKRGNRPKMLSLEDEDLKFSENLGSDPTDLKDKLIDLSSEMRTVVQILKDSPSELIFLSKSFTLIESIIQYLKRFKGWQKDRLDRTREEIRFSLEKYENPVVISG